MTIAELPNPPLRRFTGLYLGLSLAAVALFCLIRGLGNQLVVAAPGALPAMVSSGPELSALVQLLVALVTIIALSQGLGRLLARLGQPAVIGEILAGLLLGPSCLGAVAPSAVAWLLPARVMPFLSALSQVGVILYMFLIGLELDSELLRRRSRTSLAISHASIVVPFLAGAALALGLYSAFARPGAPFTAFALFCGVAMSVTAFPVLARILRDRGMAASPIGSVAIACAAVDDVTAWCLLAFVVGFVESDTSRAALTLVLSAAYLALMLLMVKPALERLVARHGEGQVSQTALALVLVALLASSLATELIGIHAIFGAFVMGLVIPTRSKLAEGLAHRIEDLVVVMLLPIFFVHTGTRVQIGLLTSAADWLFCGLIIAIACAGKFGGTALAARFTGYSWRDAAVLGTLMNTRGLVELIVLNIGLDLGVLSPSLFTMFVIMALVTTASTSPVLHWLGPKAPAVAA